MLPFKITQQNIHVLVSGVGVMIIGIRTVIVWRYVTGGEKHGYYGEGGNEPVKTKLFSLDVHNNAAVSGCE